jgi:retron-type reverse transcriptase
VHCHLFAKVLQKLVYKQLQSFLERNNILYKYQFGFRKGHSTEQAMMETTDKLKVACGLFFDFSKAFDTVNHLLLSELSKCSI